MNGIPELLGALWIAALAGDSEAATFLQMFAPWTGKANDHLLESDREGTRAM